MTNSHRLATVRAHFCAWIADTASGAGKSHQSEDLSIVSESLLIRDDFYCGRSFHTATYRAVWFIEEDELKIHEASGSVVAVFQGDEIGRQEVSSEPSLETTDIIKIDTDKINVISDPTVAADSDQGEDDDLRRAA